jgi:chromosome segregation ATPase
LQARQVRSGRGPEWQIYQTDLEKFKAERDHAALEGQEASQLSRPGEESQALSLSLQLIATELERRSLALSEAQATLERSQATIERLAHEAGRQAGRTEALERERESLLKRIATLEQERDHWHQQAQTPPPKTPRRLRLLHWRKED